MALHANSVGSGPAVPPPVEYPNAPCPNSPAPDGSSGPCPDGHPIFFDGVDSDNDGNYETLMQYEINCDGLDVLQSIMSDLDDNGIVENKASFDENGDKYLEEHFNNETGVKEKEVRFDSDGNVESETTFSYDENGNKVGSVTVDAEGNVVETSEYFYDDDGNYIGHTRTEADGTDHGFMKTFDENGNQTGEIWDYGDYGYTYTFDEEGNRIKQDFVDTPEGRQFVQEEE